jgi:hypothetical protein
VQRHEHGLLRRRRDRSHDDGGRTAAPDRRGEQREREACGHSTRMRDVGRVATAAMPRSEIFISVAGKRTVSDLDGLDQRDTTADAGRRSHTRTAGSRRCRRTRWARTRTQRCVRRPARCSSLDPNAIRLRQRWQRVGPMARREQGKRRKQDQRRRNVANRDLRERGHRHHLSNRRATATTRRTSRCRSNVETSRRRVTPGARQIGNATVSSCDRHVDGTGARLPPAPQRDDRPDASTSPNGHAP